MTQEPSNQDGIELAYASLAVFADDGTIDQDELDGLIKIAMRDGTFSDSEKAVLRGIFNRILEEDVDAGVWQQIQELREAHSI
jgi:hypothetical protein